MKEIFQEYGGILITITAIIAIITVISALIGADGNGVVGQAFGNLITTFFQNANAAAGI